MNKRISKIIVIITISLLFIYVAASWFMYDQLSRIPKHNVQDKDNIPSRFTKLVKGFENFNTQPYFMGDYDDVSFPSRDPGLIISAWYIPQVESEKDQPAIIVVHGHKSNKTTSKGLLTAGMLWRNGFNILLIDLRDNGDSSFEDGRTALGNDEYLDVLGAWDWLQYEKGFSAEKIGLVGGSLGGATVLIAFGEEQRIAAVFSDSAYSDLKTVITEELKKSGYPKLLMFGGLFIAKWVYGDDLLAFPPSNGVLQSDIRPVFILHSKKDDVVKFHHAQTLIASGKDNPNLQTWITSENHHVKTMFSKPELYEKKIVEFFKKSLN